MKLELISNDMYGENSCKIYECQKIVNKIGTNYKYTCENGLMNDVFFLEKKVLINRSGEINSKQVFSLDDVNAFMYQTPYMTTELSIKTLKYEKKDKGFELQYQIYSGGSLLNELSIFFNEK